MSKVHFIKEVCPEKIVLGKIKDRNITFYYPDDSSGESFSLLRIQTPQFKIPFDVDERKTKDGRVFMKSMTISTNDIGSSKNLRDIKRFRKKIEEIDNRMVSLLPEEYQTRNFYKSLYQGKNENFKPTMKIGIPFDRDETCKVPIFDYKNEHLPDSEIGRGDFISSIITLEGIWLSSGKMGVNWNAWQIKSYGNSLDSNKSRVSFKSEEFPDEDIPIQKFKKFKIRLEDE